MGTSTGQQIVDNIKDHLGNRATGQIGSRGVDDACMASLNKSIRQIAKKFNPDELRQELTIDVSSASNSYDLPSGTINSLSTTIKNINTAVLLEDGETTGTLLQRIFINTLDSIEPYKDPNRTGRPYAYVIWNEDVYLYPYPEEDYTLYLKTNLWPPAITLSQLNPLNDYWEDVLEAYSTYDLYAKLQQTRDAASWFNIYRQTLKDTKAILENKPDMVQDATSRDLHIGGFTGADPALNPFSKRGW